MKKIYILFISLFAFTTTYSQTFYSENMGTPSGTTAIASHTFQNTSPIVYSGTGDVRTSTASSGYTGASGSGNVFLTSTAGKYFQIDGLNTSAYLQPNIKLSFGYLTNNTGTQMVVEYSTNAGANWTAITFTQNTNTSWNLVSVTLGQIPSSANLSLRFTQPATAQMRLDDVKLTNVSSTCALVLAPETKACDAVTSALDTYTVTIPFTGGGTATYTITPTTGTVGGDNPSTSATGNILISGITENSSVTITITGGTCNYNISVSSPECKPINTLPLVESFSYTDGSSLGASQMWTNVNSGDNILVSSGSLSYSTVATAGNKVTFSGAGIDCFSPFTNITSGYALAGFMFNVTDMANITTDLTSTYFIGLTDALKNYKGRFFIQKSGAQYKMGLSAASTTTNYTSTLYDVNVTHYVIFGYDFANQTLVAWIDPNFSTFSTTTPPSLVEVLTTPITSLGGVFLRQDGATSTPTIVFDELKITNNANDFLATSSFNTITGLKVYPNPVNNGILSITSDSLTEKAVVIYDIMGKQVFAGTTINNVVSISTLNTGVYMIKITEEGKTATRKIVIE